MTLENFSATPPSPRCWGMCERLVIKRGSASFARCREPSTGPATEERLGGSEDDSKQSTNVTNDENQRGLIDTNHLVLDRVPLSFNGVPCLNLC